MERYADLDAFWPYYISEHRDPRSRRLHFVGTGLWLTSLVVCTLSNPLFLIGLVVMVLVGRAALRVEGTKRSFGHVAVMLLVPALFNPLFLAGVVAAYFCAWVGHFLLEHNRPATFEYPVMSLVSDLRMFSRMVRGELWSGDPSPA